MSSPAASSSPVLAAPSPEQMALEYEKLKVEFAKQSERGNALVLEYNKALSEKAALAADKAALQKKIERGGASKLLALATKFSGAERLPVEEWVEEVERHFDFFHIGEAEKVDTAVMLLKGHAAHWWSTLPEKAASWRDFAAKLKEMFQPISSVDKARIALDHCLQGSRSVQAYTDHFNRLMAFLPKMEADDQKHRYTTNLSAPIQREVLKAKPKSLQEAIHAAVSAEAYGNLGNRASTKVGSYYPARAYGGGSGASSGHAPMEVSNLNMLGDGGDEEKYPADSSASSAASPSSGGASPDPSLQLREMRALIDDLRAQQKVQQSISALFQRGGGAPKKASASHVPGVSKADYERCRKEGRCLKCKGLGHIARECDKPASLKF